MGVLEQVLFFNYKKKMAHRDIKSENFIVYIDNGHPVVTLVDVGVAILLEGMTHGLQTHIAGTPGYIPPERESTPFQRDLYSAGIVLAELFTRCNYQAAFRDLRSKKKLQNEFKLEVSHEDIKNIMNDVMTGHMQEELINEIYHKMMIQILEIISALTDENPARRTPLKELRAKTKTLKRLVELQKKAQEVSCGNSGKVTRKASEPSAFPTSKPLLVRRASDHLLGMMGISKTPPGSPPTGSPKGISLQSNPSSPHTPTSMSPHSSQNSPHSSHSSGNNSPHVRDVSNVVGALISGYAGSPRSTEVKDALDKLGEMVNKLEVSLKQGEYTGNAKGTLLLFSRNIKAVLDEKNMASQQEGLEMLSKQLQGSAITDDESLNTKLAQLSCATQSCMKKKIAP